MTVFRVQKRVFFWGSKKVRKKWSVAPGIDPENPKKCEKRCLLAFFRQKNTVSWGIVHRKSKIGPLLGRSFAKWFAL